MWTRDAYMAHLEMMGAKKVKVTDLYVSYRFGEAEVRVYKDRATVRDKELCVFDGQKSAAD